jgi:hypothetical protein
MRVDNCDDNDDDEANNEASTGGEIADCAKGADAVDIWGSAVETNEFLKIHVIRCVQGSRGTHHRSVMLAQHQRGEVQDVHAVATGSRGTEVSRQ